MCTVISKEKRNTGIPVQLSGLDHLAGAATGVISWLMALWPARPEFGLSLLTSLSGGGWPVLSVGLLSGRGIPPLIDPYPRNWTLPGSAVALWGKRSHLYHWARRNSLISPHPQKEFA
jgi:hypothetical protein